MGPLGPHPGEGSVLPTGWSRLSPPACGPARLPTRSNVLEGPAALEGSLPPAPRSPCPDRRRPILTSNIFSEALFPPPGTPPPDPRPPTPTPDPDRSPAHVLCSDSSSGLGAPLTQSCPSLPRPPRPPTAKTRPPALPARVGSWAGAPGQRGWIWLGLSRFRAGKALAQCVKTFAPQPAITQGNPTSWSAGWPPLPPVTPE